MCEVLSRRRNCREIATTLAALTPMQETATALQLAGKQSLPIAPPAIFIFADRTRPRRKEWRRCAGLRLVFLLLVALQVAEATTGHAKAKGKVAAAWTIQSQPAALVNGSPVLFSVLPPMRLSTLSARWLEHDVFFARESSNKNWIALAGVSLETPPGTYPLELQGTTAQGRKISFVGKFVIEAGDYKSVAVTVAKQFTEPSPEQLEVIQKDKAIKQEVFRHTASEREWLGSFLPPVDARVSDVFGTRRVFNGKVQSMHQGLDYAVPQGTPVAAVNAGTVLLASPLYFEGNCVMLDHGQGLMTLYLHLSELRVKAGDRVTGGQVIGISGGTGRASGPHLHLAVRWQGVYLNPATLLTLKLP